MKFFEMVKRLWNKKLSQYFPEKYCEGKTNKELIQQLKTGSTEINSGNMIVLELLERMNTKIENALGPHILKNENEEQKF